jgi:hypothetical protein
MKTIVTILLLLATTPAWAQQNPQAEQLFRSGRELVKQGKYAEGCEKLEASQRIEASINTLLNLGSCREKNGQVATAWAIFVRAAADARKAGDQQLAAIANDFVAKLEPRLPYVTVSVPDTSRVEGLVLQLDGRTLDSAEYNQGVPVDAGSHEVVGQAPGHEPWKTTVTVAAAERKSVEVPRFKTLRASTALESKLGDQNQQGQTPLPEGESGMPTMRKVAIGAVAVGAVGLVGMTVFGLQASSDWNTAQDSNDDQLRKDAESKATLATVSGIVGGVAIAAGVTLWIVGRPKTSERAALRPVVTRDAVGFVIGGRF